MKQNRVKVTKRIQPSQKLVAKKVIKQMIDGEGVSVKRAMEEVGYSKSTADTQAKRVTTHKAYIKEMINFDDMLDSLIVDALQIVSEKKENASYRDGLDGVTKLKKLQRLLNGESTENIANNISGLLDSLE